MEVHVGRTVRMLVALTFVSAPLGAQDRESLRPAVESILATSQLATILETLGPGVASQVREVAPDLTEAEAERLDAAIQIAFATPALYEDVVGVMLEEAVPALLADTDRWLREGASEEVRRLADAYQPPLSLPEYAETLRSSPPPESRVRLLVEWADVQGAGDFYVILQELSRQGAHDVLSALRTDAPSFEPLGAEEYAVANQTYLAGAVINFLYRFETVPDALIRRSITDYASESGAWYVQSYSIALGEAIRRGCARVVLALRA